MVQHRSILLFIYIIIHTLTPFFILSFIPNKISPFKKIRNHHILHATPSPTLTFSKYQGLGNDFIILDNRHQQKLSLTHRQSSRLCRRHFNIGADGVIFALAPPVGKEHMYDLSMRIINSDGSEPEMCGNGIRCLAAFLRDNERESVRSNNNDGEQDHTYRIHTLAGKISPTVNADGSITVDMGAPILEAQKIPITLTLNNRYKHLVEETVTSNGKSWTVYAVSMGNPHAIVFVHDLEKDVDLHTDGPFLESHPIFPEKTNVEFVQVLSENHLRMKVWERGCGVTLACGTGACAVVVAAIQTGKIPSSEGAKGVRVSLQGGYLVIQWSGGDRNVFMTGPAEFCFKGVTRIENMENR